LPTALFDEQLMLAQFCCIVQAAPFFETRQLWRMVIALA
jgi:hypothetical protein